MPRLLVEIPDEPPKMVELRDGLTAGRNETADIILLDSLVSRQHLRFRRGLAGDYVVIDEKSSHGTKVNGKPIKSHLLADGDVIEVGRVRIKFMDPIEASIVVRVKDTSPLAEEKAAEGEVARRLGVFYDLARAISQLEDINGLIGRMLEAILDVLHCERGVVGLYDPSCAPDGLRRIVRVRGGEAPAEVIISRTLIDATLTRRQGIIASDTLRAKSLVDQKILSAMGVPLLFGERVLGFIYVDDRAKGERFLERDLDFLGALAHITAAAVENAERYQRAVTAALVLRAESPLGELIGDSPSMRLLKSEIQKYAAAPTAPVLIRGESGTGKELVARTLHALSPRAGMPLVTLNCAAMPETMVESELFGHVRGAFTGAFSDKRGKFVLADGGTLFLDEIGDLSLSAQAKVLRAVQQGEVQPVGSEKTLRVNVRILAATHKDLAAEVAAGRFREALLYRLNVLELWVPPLRERAEDLPRLAQVFLAEAARRMGKSVAGFTPQALAALVRHRFPGNVRELQNEAERAAIVVEGGSAGREAAVVGIEDLSSRITGGGLRGAEAQRSARTLAELYAELEPKERALVEEALERGKGNIAEAARLLGISRSMIKVRMKRFGLDEEEAD
ncbi:MAG: sigma 54-interacting transcriptional regulator [Polyangiaceae bacterium]|nr:sigma 54-interacting transcriptional regulator [Polyangiaceae bacterium]